LGSSVSGNKVTCVSIKCVIIWGFLCFKKKCGEVWWSFCKLF